jgi:hypothetical protein
LIAAISAYTEMFGTPLEARNDKVYNLLLDNVIVASDDIPGNGTSGFGDKSLHPEGLSSRMDTV